MALKTITYFINGKNKKLEVKICDTLFKKFLGLMFRKKSPPLLFIFDKNKTISIHSLFCKPFKSIWLDEKMHVTKITDVKKWKLNILGRGKYLLEIPTLLKNNKSSSTKITTSNRNI